MAVAALISPAASIESDAICIKGAMVGRFKTLTAKKSARKKDTIVNTKPTETSNIKPVKNMLLISLVLPSARNWAVNFIIAELTPQSLKMPIMAGTVRTTVYKPYSSEPRRRAMNIVPTAEITVETIKPQSKSKLPLAETFAISPVLLMRRLPA